ncbi:MAG: hypothetical protein ACRD88_16135 [Terriglobia bacterium]
MQKSPELAFQLGKVRNLIQRFKAGGPEAFEPFRELVSRLLSLTIMQPGSGVGLFYYAGRRERGVVAGLQSSTDPLALTNGGYLRLSITLYVAPASEGHRLKVAESSFQYQADRDGKNWVFRYDYLRNPPHQYPGAHLQIRGTLSEQVLHERMLEKIHFPTWRIPLESVVRLLADQFQVPCNAPPELWRPVLAESEKAFAEIAHKPLT